MVRKPSENPKAKESILKAAQGLILAQGYSATSLDAICHKAKLTKGSFFHYFKSKEELGQELVKRFCSLAQEKIAQCCCPTEKIRGAVSIIILT